MDGIKGMWSLNDPHSCFHGFLVQAYTFETRVLKVDDEEMCEFEIEGLCRSESSLFCGNMLDDIYIQVLRFLHIILNVTVLQVTPTSIRLVDAISLKAIDIHSFESKITVAFASTSHLAFAQAGGRLTYMSLDLSARVLVNTSCTTLKHDIACLSFEHTQCTSTDLTAQDILEGQSESKFLAVGLWTENCIRILSLPNLLHLQQIELGSEAPQVRDVLIVQLFIPSCGHEDNDMSANESSETLLKNHSANLLVGLGNGTLISLTLDLTEPTPLAYNRQEVVLGSRPLSFSCFQNEGALCVFVCGDRPTVIKSRRNNDSLLYSPVNLPGEVNSMIPFNSAQCPNCLAMSSETRLLIGSVDSLNKIHVQKFPLGESPRHICHHRSTSTLAGIRRHGVFQF